MLKLTKINLKKESKYHKAWVRKINLRRKINLFK